MKCFAGEQLVLLGKGIEVLICSASFNDLKIFFWTRVTIYYPGKVQFELLLVPLSQKIELCQCVLFSDISESC